MNEFHRHSTARMTAKSKISTRQESQNEIYDDKVVLMEGKKGVEYVATAQQSWEKWAELYIEILSIVGEEIKIQFRWKGFDPPFNVGCWFFFLISSFSAVVYHYMFPLLLFPFCHVDVVRIVAPYRTIYNQLSYRVCRVIHFYSWKSFNRLWREITQQCHCYSTLSSKVLFYVNFHPCYNFPSLWLRLNTTIHNYPTTFLLIEIENQTIIFNFV